VLFELYKCWGKIYILKVDYRIKMVKLLEAVALSEAPPRTQEDCFHPNEIIAFHYLSRVYLVCPDCNARYDRAPSDDDYKALTTKIIEKPITV